MEINELNNIIENTILKLQLSPNSPLMTLPEQEKFIFEYLEKFHDEINRSSGLERAFAINNYVQILELYWKLIESYFKANQGSKNPNTTRDAKLKVIDFINKHLSSSIAHLKTIYQNESLEPKVVIGKSLARIYFIYTESAKNYFGQSSPEHMSIYTQAINDLEGMKI